MDERPTHYLESFDSVRSRVAGADVTDRSQLAAQTLSAQAETIVALAMGRDIVAPQSYVLDSVACQAVIGTIAEARTIVRRRHQDFWDDRAYPFRIHLHQFNGTTHTRFLELTLAVLSATVDGTFTSSMFPDLRHHDAAEDILSPANLQGSQPLSWLQNDRNEWRVDLFHGMWDYLRTSGRGTPRIVVTARPIRPHLTLTSGLEVVRRRLASQAEETGLGAALETLYAANPSPDRFAGRGWVHGDNPWEPGGRSARALVDDPAIFRQVLEIVDTVYNQVVSNSIGPAASSYSTDLMLEDDLSTIDDVVSAQDAALGADDAEDAEQRPSFEVSVGLGEKDTEKWHQLGTPEVVAAVLEARESQKWQKSFRDLRDAGDDRRFTKAWAAHLKLIAKATSGEIDVHDGDQSFLVRIRNFAGETVVAGSSAVMGVGLMDPRFGYAAAGAPVAGRAYRRAIAASHTRGVYRTLGRSVAHSRTGSVA